MSDVVELVIIRHGRTPGNDERRYVGIVDQPLSDAGREQARASSSGLADKLPDVQRVYVSVLRRTSETASILFPEASQVVVEGIQEMNFGEFAGRTADEMSDDAAYRAWVEGNCEGRCPSGESKDEFTDRVCCAMEKLVRDAHSRGERRVVVVAHGGTLMASMSRFADGGRTYYEWHVGNCEGYRMRAHLDERSLRFTDVERL